jgi:RNA polymerase sigma factor FliA
LDLNPAVFENSSLFLLEPLVIHNPDSLSPNEPIDDLKIHSPSLEPLSSDSETAKVVAEINRETVVHSYLHLVKYVVGRMSVNLPAHINNGDLINEGVIGLLDAAKKYDPARGVKFETYAVTRINGSILDFLRAEDWAPRSVRQKAREIDKAEQELESQLGRHPTEAELAEQLKIGITELQRAKTRVRNATVVYLEEPLSNDRGQKVSLLDNLASHDDEIGSGIALEEIKQTLRDSINKLPPKERTVISLYYFDGLTLKEIRNVLGVSESRVSQIHSKAINQLYSDLKRVKEDLGFHGNGTSKKRASRDTGKSLAPQLALA